MTWGVFPAFSFYSASNLNRAHWFANRPASRVAADLRNSCGVCRLDDNARRGFPRASRLLPGAVENREQFLATKVFLFIHLRVLLQSLCGGAFSYHHAIQVAVSGMARIFHRFLCAGMGCQPVHEHLQPSSARHQARAGGDSRQRKRRSGANAQGGLSASSCEITLNRNAFALRSCERRTLFLQRRTLFLQL